MEQCPECKALWQDGITCRDHFDQVQAWEFEDPAGAGAFHNLTVLCYNLQHPSVYSPEGLIWATKLLTQFVVESVTPEQVRRQNRHAFDSGERAYKIVGNPDSHGKMPIRCNGRPPLEMSRLAAWMGTLSASGPGRYLSMKR